MTEKTQTADIDVPELLAMACARNLSVEFHFEEDNEFRRARTRLLKIDGQTLHIDLPKCIGKRFTLRSRQIVTVYFRLAQTDYAFKSQVIGPIISTGLNHKKRVEGAVLRMPSSVRQQQRRNDYRVSIALHNIAASFGRLDNAKSDRAPIGATRYEGRVVNLSGGGVAVTVAAVAGLKFRVNDQYRITFDLPGVEQCLVLPVEVRSVRTMHNHQTLLIGFEFRARYQAENRRQIHQICKFITEEQRRQIRRMRGG
jgi:c-di-GMP-binding flagellar brake protein YcgR